MNECETVECDLLWLFQPSRLFYALRWSNFNTHVKVGMARSGSCEKRNVHMHGILYGMHSTSSGPKLLLEGPDAQAVSA